MNRSVQVLRKLMGMIARTEEHELDCGEVFAVLDLYAEAVERGEDVSQLYPLVAHHLEMCSDCLEEYQALVSVIQAVH